MRASKSILVFLAIFVLSVPAPAHAWFGWLDNLSGPGPFIGVAVQYRLACVNDPKPKDIIFRKFQADLLAQIQSAEWSLVDAQLAVARRAAGPESGKEDDIKLLAADVTNKLQDLKRAQAATINTDDPTFTNAVQTQRNLVDPGDGVLRSLNSFDDSQPKVAKAFGGGCVVQPGKNPIASLNLRLAGYLSVQNTLKYSEPQYASGGPLVALVQPELSFTVFVDPRKSVEVGIGAGISIPFVDKPDVPVRGRFYWRPIILSVAPAPLLRTESNNFLRSIMFVSSLVITPQAMKASDFGAIPDSYSVDKDWQGQFGILFDMTRFGTHAKAVTPQPIK